MLRPRWRARLAVRACLWWGGGVAGLTAAYDLRRRLGDHAEITLVSEQDYFSLGPALLWAPFGGTTYTIGFSIAAGLERHGIRFVQARADQIDPARRVVRASNQGRDTERTLPRVRDLRLLDGGDAGVRLVTADLGRPLHLALLVPGRVAHGAKEALTHYLLWKLRTGRASLP